jgi:hypothetical protein
MDRGEIGPSGSHISARNQISGIDVTVYLTPRDWQELAESGSCQVSQTWDDAPPDARVVRVTIYQR